MQKLVVGMAMMFFFFTGSLWALSGKGTTSATFLKIGVGSRAVAMGEAYVAVADDPSAVYWNPAGIVTLTAPSASFMHVFWLEDIYFDYIAGVLPTTIGTLGASIIYLNHGDLLRSYEQDTPDDASRGVFHAADLAVTLAYGARFSRSMQLGANVKLFSESIDGQDSFGAALDLGFLYELPWEKIKLGFVLQNLGPATRLNTEFFRLPLNFKIGLGYQPWGPVMLSLEYNQLLEQAGKIGLGVEYVYEKIVALRAGYQYQGAIDQGQWYQDFGTNTLSGFTAGVGITYADFQLDYAYVPYGFLGAAHRITLTYALAQPEPVSEPAQPTPSATPVARPETVNDVESKLLEKRMADIEDKINVGVLKIIQFRSGSAELLPTSQATLEAIAEEFKKFPNLKILIEGHTDSRGQAEDNQVLSQLRVERVKSYLVLEHGLNPNNFEAVGYGETKPIADNSTEAGRQKNRRVEFKILSPKG